MRTPVTKYRVGNPSQRGDLALAARRRSPCAADPGVRGERSRSDATPSRVGTPEEIERGILLRQVLETLTPEERLVCIWKKAGFSSREIADRRGGTAAAVDTLLSRVRQKVRKLLGDRPGDSRRDEDGGVDDGAKGSQRADVDTGNRDAE
jgi:DNA-binding CsgD family transcriptional regulator